MEYDPFNLLVELDGRDGHEGVGRFRDMNRDNLHVLLDERTLRFGLVRKVASVGNRAMREGP